MGFAGCARCAASESELSPYEDFRDRFYPRDRHQNPAPSSLLEMQSEIARDHSNHDNHADDVENHCFAPIGVLVRIMKGRRAHSRVRQCYRLSQRHCWAIVPDRQFVGDELSKNNVRRELGSNSYPKRNEFGALRPALRVANVRPTFTSYPLVEVIKGKASRRRYTAHLDPCEFEILVPCTCRPWPYFRARLVLQCSGIPLSA
jgi:hypothetical protein